MFILTHQSHPDSRGEFDGFSKNKIFSTKQTPLNFHDGEWRVSCSIDHVFKEIAFLQRKKFVRNSNSINLAPFDGSHSKSKKHIDLCERGMFTCA